MIQYNPKVTEIVIARFTHFPYPDEIKQAWNDAKRAEEVGKEFPFRNVDWRKVDRGYEIFVTKA